MTDRTLHTCLRLVQMRLCEAREVLKKPEIRHDYYSKDYWQAELERTQQAEVELTEALKKTDGREVANV